MRKVNLKDVPEQERKSLKGNFYKFANRISSGAGSGSRTFNLKV
jgi:hypothetical protein